MKSKLLLGTATAVLALSICSHAGSAATLDDVMRRLDKLEKENADLRKQVHSLQAAKGVAAGPVASAPAGAKGNPVLHGAVAPSPPAPTTIAGMPVKAGPLGPIIDNTTVTLYGHFDLSVDGLFNSVFDQGDKAAIASNGSYFGIRARHNLAPYGYDGYSIVAQMEAQIDAASAPTERAALGTRDTYLGVEGPWGAVKLGKEDTPYKKATAAFDPFANTVADYNSIMGNTGGDNRAEFDWRMNHSIWYESPIWNGFQFSALASPGQNYAQDNSDLSYGDYFQCNGASARGSGSGFPGTNGTPLPVNALGSNGCTDGSFGDAYSIAGTYKNGPWTAIAAYELHMGVNREGDDDAVLTGGVPIILPNGQTVVTGVHNEWAAKIGGGYRFTDPLGDLQLYAYYEWMRRDVTAAEEPFNERSRDGVFASATQFVGKWSFSASYAHAFATPGNPATLSVNDPVLAPAATLQANLFDDSANMYALGTRYRFNQWASWYLVGSVLTQGQGAHYCLGVSGHGYALCGRDAANDTIGGATLSAVSSGLTFDF
ncbi:MAG TPA: porin [Xanthobacteraceae bacterium]|nr:porin [Xanthobacteraceae bacterium]